MEVYSSQNIADEYLTLKGIELRTGIKGEELSTAVVGELLDNSIDDIENHGVNDPQVLVAVSINKSVIKVSVRNSLNPNRNHVFSKGLLESVYKFGSYYSSKKFYKINRGALGDASKLMLGTPYALADSININLAKMGVHYPITHKTSAKNILKTFHVGLENGQAKVIEDKQIPSKENYTEVEILLPYYNNADNGTKTIIRIHNFLINYALPNTHIGFTFNLPPPYKEKYFPAIQPLINAGKNLSSPHFYDLSEFRQFIYELNAEDQTFYDIALKTFRGANNLPRNDLTLTTIGQLKKSPAKIQKIFNIIHEKIPSISPEIGLPSMIPFNTSKKFRKTALQSRLAKIGISCDRIKYKQEYGYYEFDNGVVKYPYFFETFIGHVESGVTKNLTVVQSINCKVSDDILVYGGPYSYETGSNKWRYKANSIFDIFEHYGYSHNEKKCKKRNNIILINLISPRVNYQSHGKSRIDHTPFAKVIAATVVNTCRGGNDINGKVDQIVGLRQVLRSRRIEYLAKQDPLEKKKRQATQSDVFYATRKLLISDYGYTDKEINRKYITESIRKECAKLGVTREEIGIIAADRAQLYFNGKWYDVGLDEMETLIEYGTDMVIIEKEGVIIQISSFSDGKRIALLNTRGFLVDYASRFAKLANERGCNIAIIVDWDASGLLMYLKVKKLIPSLKRIGVDFKTVKDLGLRLGDVEEKYEGSKNKHFDALKHELDEALEDAKGNKTKEEITEFRYLQSQLDYLKEKRIEINSIIAQLKDNEKFYGWIEDELRDAFQYRIFTRSSEIPEYVKPTILQELDDAAEEIGKEALKPHIVKLQVKLDNNNIKNAFLFDRTNRVKPNYNYNDYNAAIKIQSKKIIENNCEMKPYIEIIKELLKRVPTRCGGRQNGPRSDG
jgi:hypothetical protein